MKKIVSLLLILIFLLSGCLSYEPPADKLVKLDAIKTVKEIDYPGERINLVVDGVDVLVIVTKKTDLAAVKLGGVNVTAKISKSHHPRIFTIGERCLVEYYD